MKNWLGMWTVCLVTALGFSAAARGADTFQVFPDPQNGFSFFVTQGNAQAIKIDISGWGPDWAWVSVSGRRVGTGDPLEVVGRVTIRAPQERGIDVRLRVSAAGPRSVVLAYELQAEKEVPLTMLVPTLSAPAGGAAQAVITSAAGKGSTLTLPARPASFDAASKISFTGEGWKGPIEVALSPALRLAADGGIRVLLASDVLQAGQTKGTLTLTFPADVELLTKTADMEKLAPVLPTPDWFAYKPRWDAGPSVIGMENWLDKPAGAHGAVKMAGDHFEFTDGTVAKFWGVNLSYASSAPMKADADFTAARFARFGVNAVRMHKFTGSGWEGIGDPKDATKFTADGLDRLDYFASRLAQAGIYYGWSHTYHFKVRPENQGRIAGFDELMKKGGDTYGVINWAEDVQDLMIEQVVNLLQHKNRYTGKTYAEDPALCFVELQNEDDIFFFTSETAYNDFPTYRKQLQKRFAEWLAAKYGTQEKLAGVWLSALRPGETLAGGNLAVQANPWFMGADHLPGLRGGERQRMLDNAAFLRATQQRFYDKFVNAIRAAGYTGPVVGSPWQAPSMLPHYANLQVDAAVGYVDRHDYFGGGLSDSMMHAPGGGYLSAGLQQVAGRPFGLSEWIHVYPSLYSAEGPVLVAAYGMGLQGWDASYEFQSTSARPGESVGNEPYGVWNADAPTQLGQFPLLARMVLRGDIKEGPVVSVRRVAGADLAGGTFNFQDKVVQQGDVKVFGGAGVPAEMLAAGRAVVEFVDVPTASALGDLAPYARGKVVTSATGELQWDAGAGVVTIDTPGTQGVVGFAAGTTLKLRDVTIACQSPYASILVTADERTGTLAKSKRVLVSVVARNANAGFRCLTVDGKTIVENGKGPVMLEPVKGEVTFPRRRVVETRILDMDGRETGRQAEMKGSGFLVDGVKDQTLYYEVVLE